MISVERAGVADSATIFDWRNDAGTRAASVSHDVVEWADHEHWYASVLSDPNRFLYVAKDGPGGTRIGLCRFDLSGDCATAEVSINLNPAFRGQRLAGTILGESIACFKRDTGTDVRLTATIRPENVASVRTFESLGFVRSGSEEQLDHYVL